MGRSNVLEAQRSKSRTQPAPGADFLALDVSDAPPGRLAGWLAGQLRLAIADGRLPLGGKLPPSRLLAAELSVSRGVVTEAYQRLTEEGTIAGRGRAGTIVVAVPVAQLPAAVPDTAAAGRRPLPAVPGGDIFDALRAAPARFDFSPGLPDLGAFPRAAWLRAERSVLSSLSATALGYGDPRGAPRFRTAIAQWLARNRGIRIRPDDVVVVAGVAQSLALLARVLRNDGIADVAVEDPGSLGARQQLQAWSMRTPPVPVDDGGLRIDLLRATGAPAVLLTPAHQFPTGVVLEGARRRALLRWAADGGVVIEDDYDAEHRYDRPPVPALRAMTEAVCYTGSISKLLAPGLRVGWLAVPDKYRDATVMAKRDADLGCPVLPQLVLAQLMECGELERHLRVVRARHRRRRDAMIDALRRCLPNARVHGAAAGLHLTVTFDTEFDDIAAADAALDAGVKVHPLTWHRQLAGPPGFVLGYAANTVGAISDGVEALAGTLGTLRTGR
jgi:GntR family transcriptional regulator / MocR family aminotransferase